MGDPPLAHDKTDAFLARLEECGAAGRRVRAALEQPMRDRALRDLAALEEELLAGAGEPAELHAALLGVYLAYREHQAYRRMVDLEARLPSALRGSTIVREQLALALGRLAEQEQDSSRARELRRRALAILDELAPGEVTSESWGLRGRVHKGEYEAARAAGDEQAAAEHLDRAIAAYEAGLEADPRDYYPGVNAITLRLLRQGPGDGRAVERLVPRVRRAVERAPVARSAEERYWQAATLLEIASATRKWQTARERLERLLALESRPWMRETTARNLSTHRRAFAHDREAVEEIDRLIDALT